MQLRKLYHKTYAYKSVISQTNLLKPFEHASCLENDQFVMFLYGAYIPCPYFCVWVFVNNSSKDVFCGGHESSASQIAGVLDLNR